jgi:hypothetical protein
MDKESITRPQFKGHRRIKEKYFGVKMERPGSLGLASPVQ